MTRLFLGKAAIKAQESREKVSYRITNIAMSHSVNSIYDIFFYLIALFEYLNETKGKYKNNSMLEKIKQSAR